MNDGKEPGTAETPDKSQNSSKSYQERFNAALREWKTYGCQHAGGDNINPQGKEVCGGDPHRVRMLPADESGHFTLSVGCASGHDDVWHFKVSEAEMRADLAQKAAAAQQAGADAGRDARNPDKAFLKITMDMKTQEVSIDPWVPNPGLGIQLAGILMSHFFAQLQSAGAPAPKLALPEKRILHPKTGRPITN